MAAPKYEISRGHLPKTLKTLACFSKFQSMFLAIHNTVFIPSFEQTTQGLFKNTFPIFQGLHSVQKRA